VIPRITTGKSVTGAVRYALGPDTKRPKPGNPNRVDWISGQGFGFDINTTDDAHLARRVMEFDALNQTSRTRKCEQDCVHLNLSLGWRPGETPERREMEAAARGALQALGMANAKALFIAHNDKEYAHLHVIASKINPDTGRAYDLKGSWQTLATWAQAYDSGGGRQ
jgi:Relaxase/Mobilisation nuclease domain